MKKKNKVYKFTKLLTIAVISLFFIIMFVVGIFFPRVTLSDYDEGLAKFPEFSLESLLSGEFADGLTKWYSDTIYGRDGYKDLAARIRAWYGPQKEEEIFGDNSEDESEQEHESSIPTYSEDPIFKEESIPDISDPLTSETESQEVSTEDSQDVSTETSTEVSTDIGDIDNEEIIDNIIIDSKYRAMEVYSYSTSSTGGLTYAEYMNKLNADLKKINSNITLYSMFIPKQCAYYLGDVKNESYRNKAGNSLIAINQINNALDDGIVSVDVYNALLKHKDEHIYFRTDHHWTGLGAYYGTEALAKAAGVGYLPLSTYTVETRQGFLGTMYKYTNYSTKLLNNPEDFTMYKTTGLDYTCTYHEYNDFDDTFEHDIFWNVAMDKKSSWYMMFMNGDSYILHIKSNECHNGRKIVILKDSYGNAMSPYLLGSFEEIWLIDIRNFEGNILDFVKKNDITDVSVSMCALSVTGSINKHIERIRTQGR